MFAFLDQCITFLKVLLNLFFVEIGGILIKVCYAILLYECFYFLFQ